MYRHRSGILKTTLLLHIRLCDSRVDSRTCVKISEDSSHGTLPTCMNRHEESGEDNECINVVRCAIRSFSMLHRGHPCCISESCMPCRRSTSFAISFSWLMGSSLHPDSLCRAGAYSALSGPSTSYMRDRDARRGVSSGGVLERVCTNGGMGGICAQWKGDGAMATLGGYVYTLCLDGSPCWRLYIMASCMIMGSGWRLEIIDNFSGACAPF